MKNLVEDLKGMDVVGIMLCWVLFIPFYHSEAPCRIHRRLRNADEDLFSSRRVGPDAHQQEGGDTFFISYFYCLLSGPITGLTALLEFKSFLPEHRPIASFRSRVPGVSLRFFGRPTLPKSSKPGVRTTMKGDRIVI